MIYIVYQSIYQSSFIEDCERPYNDTIYIIVFINHHLSKTVEDQAVLPHHDRGHQSPHTQHIVGLGGILIVVVIATLFLVIMDMDLTLNQGKLSGYKEVWTMTLRFMK